MPEIPAGPFPTWAEIRAARDKTILLDRLIVCGWDVTLAAETLNLSRRRVEQLMIAHNITRPSAKVRTTLRTNAK